MTIEEQLQQLTENIVALEARLQQCYISIADATEQAEQAAIRAEQAAIRAELALLQAAERSQCAEQASELAVAAAVIVAEEREEEEEEDATESSNEPGGGDTEGQHHPEASDVEGERQKKDSREPETTEPIVIRVEERPERKQPTRSSRFHRGGTSRRG